MKAMTRGEGRHDSLHGKHVVLPRANRAVLRLVVDSDLDARLLGLGLLGAHDGGRERENSDEGAEHDAVSGWVSQK